MSKSLVKNSMLVIGIVVLSKMIGFFREIILAYFYGASSTTDAYVIVTSMYALFFSAISVSITTTYIQKISKISVEKQRNIITSKLLIFTAGMVLLISVILCMVPNTVIKLFAYNLNDDAIKITINLMSIMLPFSFITTLQYILSAYMQSKNIFWFSGVALIVSNIFIILGIVLSGENYAILAIGNIVGTIICALLALIFAVKIGYRFKWNKSFNEAIKDIFILGLPIFLGQLVQQFNVVVDKNFASGLGEGVISSINYANKVNTLFITLFVISITTVLFPSLSKLSIENKTKFKDISVQTAKIVSMFALPVAISIFLLSKDIIQLLFMRGEFNADNVKVTSDILMIYSLGIPALSLNEIVNKQFYALGDMKTPVKASVATLILNISLNFILVKSLGYIGLAISTTISVTLLFILLNYQFDKKYNINIIVENKSKFLKILLSSVIMFVVVAITKSLTTNLNSLFVISVCGIVGVITYFGILLLLKDNDVMQIKNFKIKR